MKRTVLLTTLAFALLCPSAFALDALTAWGRPFGAAGVRYELWKDEGGWHLRWTGAGSPHRFSGKIWAPDGRVVILRRQRLERCDRVWREGRGIRFDAFASRGWDGFDFRWRGRRLIVDLEVDGGPCRRRIFVGAEGVHPKGQPFVIVRRRHRFCLYLDPSL